MAGLKLRTSQQFTRINLHLHQAGQATDPQLKQLLNSIPLRLIHEGTYQKAQPAYVFTQESVHMKTQKLNEANRSIYFKYQSRECRYSSSSNNDSQIQWTIRCRLILSSNHQNIQLI